MVQLEKVKELLKEYENRINLVIGYFIQKFGTKNPTINWRKGLIDRVGFLDDNYQMEYSFHGGGCSVEFSNGELVSFDFTENNDYSFDLFKFKIFIESTPMYNNEFNTDDIKLKIKKGDQGFEIESS